MQGHKKKKKKHTPTPKKQGVGVIALSATVLEALNPVRQYNKHG